MAGVKRLGSVPQPFLHSSSEVLPTAVGQVCDLRQVHNQGAVAQGPDLGVVKMKIRILSHTALNKK